MTSRSGARTPWTHARAWTQARSWLQAQPWTQSQPWTQAGIRARRAMHLAVRGLRRSARSLWQEVGRILREQVRIPTIVLMLVCVLIGIPVTILLTPDQQVTVVGQHLSVGARSPSLSLSGPAQLVQIGNTELDIAPLRVYGPLRPRLTLGPVQRNEAAAAVLDPSREHNTLNDAVSSIGTAFLHWYTWGALVLLGFALAATAVAACVRMLMALRRQSRNHGPPLTASELWHRSTGQIRGMAIGAITVSLLAWLVAGALAYEGAISGLRSVTSLSQLVGTYYLTPAPVGPTVTGYTGAVIGDSRASRVGGPPIPDGTEADRLCERSADSLAAEIGNQLQEPVLNLACSGASIAAGLRGSQKKADVTLPPQVGVLKQVEGLRFVAVVIGPNDLAWIDQLRYCYAVVDCQDNLTAGEFGYRLAAFDREYGSLLRDLNDLPGQPQVVVVTSYDIFKPDADCPDTDGPDGLPGLDANGIRLIAERNAQMNDVLVGGAEKYGFTVARPVLAPLCTPSSDQVGPDLQGIADPQPFHPTAIGMIRMAAAVVRVIDLPTTD